jgi:regulator of protease activity HflC (stomatin/prohibitin superfamily)
MPTNPLSKALWQGRRSYSASFFKRVQSEGRAKAEWRQSEGRVEAERRQSEGRVEVERKMNGDAHNRLSGSCGENVPHLSR